MSRKQWRRTGRALDAFLQTLDDNVPHMTNPLSRGRPGVAFFTGPTAPKEKRKTKKSKKKEKKKKKKKKETEEMKTMKMAETERGGAVRRGSKEKRRSITELDATESWRHGETTSRTIHDQHMAASARK